MGEVGELLTWSGLMGTGGRVFGAGGLEDVLVEVFVVYGIATGFVVADFYDLWAGGFTAVAEKGLFEDRGGDFVSAGV